jgi:hypothetical protein
METETTKDTITLSYERKAIDGNEMKSSYQIITESSTVPSINIKEADSTANKNTNGTEEEDVDWED